MSSCTIGCHQLEGLPGRCLHGNIQTHRLALHCQSQDESACDMHALHAVQARIAREQAAKAIAAEQLRQAAADAARRRAAAAAALVAEQEEERAALQVRGVPRGVSILTCTQTLYISPSRGCCNELQVCFWKCVSTAWLPALTCLLAPQILWVIASLPDLKPTFLSLSDLLGECKPCREQL
jgi:hypothetical protein